jgi:hypothetical protein
MKWNGSERQNNWAKHIRNEAIRHGVIDMMIDRIRASGDFNPIYISRAQEAGEAIKSYTDSKWWIDHRKMLDLDLMYDMERARYRSFESAKNFVREIIDILDFFELEQEQEN